MGFEPTDLLDLQFSRLMQLTSLPPFQIYIDFGSFRVTDDEIRAFTLLYLQGGTADTKMAAGGHWDCGAHCGSRSRSVLNCRWSARTDLGGRACVESE